MLVLRIYWVFWEMGVLGGKQRGEGKKDTTKTEKGKPLPAKTYLNPNLRPLVRTKVPLLRCVQNRYVIEQSSQ